VTDIELFEDILKTNTVVGFDFETTLDRYKPPICTVQIVGYDQREVVIQTWNRPDLLARCLTALRDTKALLVAHYAIFELERLLENGVTPAKIACTYVAAQVLRGAMEGGNFVTTYDLKALAKRELHVELDKTYQTSDWREPLTDASREYALADARCARDLWAIFDFEFDLDPDARRGFDLIMAALPATAICNTTGLLFDAAAHERLCVELDRQVAAAELELEILCNGEIPNTNSPQQVSRWLAEQISFEPGCSVKRAGFLFTQVTNVSWPMTATGFSLDKKLLEQIIGPAEESWPAVGRFLRARMAYKYSATLLTSFGPNLRALIDPDGRLRGRLVPHGARTSRFSCRNPNLQNQPRLEIFRALYIVPAGRKLVIADYGQIELRVGCIICNDAQMQAFFVAGRDLHAATMEKIHHVHYDSTNKTHKRWRSEGKAVTFASLYGAMAPTIALSAKLALPDAQLLLDQWLGIYPGIADFRLSQPERARKAGVVQLVSGQKIRVVGSSRPAQLINAPVQGSAASVMLRAMARVQTALAKSGLDASLCMVVHDEIILEASDRDARAAGLILQREMAAALLDLYPEARKLGMAGVADAAIVDRWSDKDADEFAIGVDDEWAA